MSTRSIHQTESWHSSDSDDSVHSSNNTENNLFFLKKDAKSSQRQMASVSQKIKKSISGAVGAERKRRQNARRASQDKNDESMKFYKHVQGHTDVGSRHHLC